MEGTAAYPSEVLRAGGWRQGSVLGNADLASLSFKGRGCAVVLTQDCDVVQSIEQEPFVELLLGDRIERPRADMLHGRNPRLLDLTISDGGATAYMSFRASERILLEKERLAPFCPSPSLSLSRDTLHGLIGWIVKRYTRAAFPDSFNERLEGVAAKLEKLVKSVDSALILGIYLIIRDGEQELAPQVDYHVTAWLAVSQATFEDGSTFKKAADFEARFKAILEACPGLVVIDVEVKSEEDISLADLRIVKRLDKDYRSLAPRPGGSVPPAGV